jgi:CHRD domain-containing protein
MMKSLWPTGPLALSAVLVLLTSGALASAPVNASPAALATQRLETQLRPSGDPDGSGEANLTFNKARGRVCATIEWHGIQTPDAAHIHKGDGSIVVDLTGSVTHGARCATGVRKSLITAILGHPGRYYVNVHNPTYPAGAIQGTLHRP